MQKKKKNIKISVHFQIQRIRLKEKLIIVKYVLQHEITRHAVVMNIFRVIYTDSLRKAEASFCHLSLLPPFDLSLR